MIFFFLIFKEKSYQTQTIERYIIILLLKGIKLYTLTVQFTDMPLLLLKNSYMHSQGVLCKPCSVETCTKMYFTFEGTDLVTSLKDNICFSWQYTVGW